MATFSPSSEFAASMNCAHSNRVFLFQSYVISWRFLVAFGPKIDHWACHSHAGSRSTHFELYPTSSTFHLCLRVLLCVARCFDDVSCRIDWLASPGAMAAAFLWRSRHHRDLLRECCLPTDLLCLECLHMTGQLHMNVGSKWRINPWWSGCQVMHFL